MKKTAIFLFTLTIAFIIFGQQAEQIDRRSSFTLAAAGDVSHTANQSYAKQYYALGAQKYEPTKKHFLESDIAFVNLESPYTNKKAVLKKKYPFYTKPDELKYIFEAGFNLFSLANNHSYDSGLAGIRDTEKYLQQNSAKYSFPGRMNYTWAGASSNSSTVQNAAFFTIPGKDLKFIFLSYANNSSKYVNTFNTAKCRSHVEKYRKLYPDHIILVSIHYGNEYEHVPQKWLINSYRSIIDAGASIILGHHPHVPQGIENYKNGIICYSLGNFSFGSKTRRHLAKKAKLYGMIAKIDAQKLVGSNNFKVKLTVVPLYLDNSFSMKVGKSVLKPRSFIPFTPDKPFSTKIMNSIISWSKRIPGNKIKYIIEENNTMYAEFYSTLNVQ